LEQYHILVPGGEGGGGASAVLITPHQENSETKIEEKGIYIGKNDATTVHKVYTIGTCTLRTFYFSLTGLIKKPRKG
jgi:hypothetical protein